MRDGELSNKVSASLQIDMGKTVKSLQPFLDAAKGVGSEDLQKWKRDKFDN